MLRKMVEAPQKTNRNESRKEKQRSYYLENIDKLSMKMGCECGGQYKWDGRWRHLQTKKHKDFMNGLEAKRPLTELEKHNRYYEYVPCPCGGSFRRHNKAKHFWTNQHKKWLAEILDKFSDDEEEEDVPRFNPLLK
jgi:hypothetical protein